MATLKKTQIDGICINNNSQNNINNKEYNKENLDLTNMKKKNENSNEIKMEIEPNTSNDLMASGSTNYSNNTHFSMESSNINVSIQNRINNEYIQSQNQNQLTIISHRDNSNNESSTTISYEEEDKNNKKIFDYNFESGNEFVLFAGEYLDEIYTNLLYDDLELKYKPKIGYMNIQKDINEQMRAILIDWLIEVHYRFRLKSETLFQTVWIIDTYLTFEQIQRAKLQLLGIASLLISCKENEMYYPRTQEFIYMTNNAYTKNELLKKEAHVLNILNFEILSPSADEFYNILSKCFSFNKEQKFLGEYFMDSSLIDYKMLKYTPSIIATACAYIVMKFYGIKKYKDLYSSNMVMMDSPQKAIKDCARDLCFFVKNLSNSSLKATKEKYSLEQFGKVSDLCEEKK